MKEIIKPTKPHKHVGYFELIFLSKGSGTHNIDDRLYQVNAPDVFFLRPNQTHCWDFSSIPKGYVLLFKEEILNNNSTRNLLHHIPAHLPVKQVDFIENLFNKLSTLNADIDIVASYINVIIHHILQETTVEAEKIDNVLFEYQKLVDDNFINLKRVTDYADKLNVSPNKLNELSKKMLGRTAHDIIKERLFIEAKVLLTHTQKTINEIALDLKFSDAPHFNKFFRACAKLTPGQYRKMLKGKNVQQNQ